MKKIISVFVVLLVGACTQNQVSPKRGVSQDSDYPFAIDFVSFYRNSIKGGVPINEHLISMGQLQVSPIIFGEKSMFGFLREDYCSESESKTLNVYNIYVVGESLEIRGFKNPEISDCMNEMERYVKANEKVLYFAESLYHIAQGHEEKLKDRGLSLECCGSKERARAQRLLDLWRDMTCSFRDDLEIPKGLQPEEKAYLKSAQAFFRGQAREVKDYVGIPNKCLAP